MLLDATTSLESKEIYYVPVYSMLQQRISISFMRKVLNFRKHANHEVQGERFSTMKLERKR